MQPRLRGRPGHGRLGPFGEASGDAPTPIAVENFHLQRDRQRADAVDTPAAPGDKSTRLNLLNWDGNGRPQGLFPSSSGADESEPRP